MPDGKYIRQAILKLSEDSSTIPSANITGTTYDSIIWGSGTTPLDETTLMAKATELETNASVNELRKVRDRLLTATDWTQGADSPLSDSDKTAWATYRQSLRDITDTYSSLDTVVWPTKP